MSSINSDNKWQSGITRLSEGFRYIYEHEELTDCKFEVDQQEFKAHKIVLSARSPVFDALLMGANPAYEIINEFDNVTAVGFKILLRFIYTDEIGTNDKSSIVQAYLAADAYQQSSLKETCDTMMSEWKITVDEVCELLNASLKVPVLKDRCLVFIKNNAKKVVSSKGFLKLTDKSIYMLLENNILRDITLASRIKRIMEWAESHQKESVDKESVDYKKVREEFLRCKPPLFQMLGLESLSLEEFTDLFIVKYEGLLNDDETKKFMKYISTNGRTSLPDWNQE